MRLPLYYLLIPLLITRLYPQGKDNSHLNEEKTFKVNNIAYTVSEVSGYARTYYDFQSYGVPRYIWQEQNNPLSIHAVFMRDPVGSPGFPNLRTIYLYSSNGGYNWQYLGEIVLVKSSYPALTVLNDGRAAILIQTQYGGTNLRIQLFVDLVQGIGIFNSYDPNPVSSLIYPLWSAGITTIDNKLIFLGSADSAYRNTCLSLDPISFLGYRVIPDAGTNNRYSIARYQSKVGIAYITGNLSSYTAGSVFFMESVNNGTNWGTPIQIWNANYYSDSIGAFNSIDASYLNGSPKVLFGLCKRSPINYFPKSPSKILSWSPDVNSGIPVLVDSAGGLSGTNPVNDGYSSVCRGAIGSCEAAGMLFAAWCRARNDTDAAGNNYFDIYLTYSTNAGLNWKQPVQLTNINEPLKDCRYVSISPYNDAQFSYAHAYLVFQKDSVPGSFVNGAGKSLAKMMFAKVTFDTIVGIQHSNKAVQNYELNQNYPNPFNPKTKIKFFIPKYSAATLTVFDVNGREAAILVKENKSAGAYDVDWNAENYPSGVYFYELRVGDYCLSRKMVLLK
jgi:hypothetical protein